MKETIISHFNGKNTICVEVEKVEGLKQDVLNLKHLLDYRTLKAWGFEWANYTSDDDNIVCDYISEFTHTDLFQFRSVSLSLVPNLNQNWLWEISLLKKVDLKTETIFRGRIDNKKQLETIFKAVLIFKP